MQPQYFSDCIFPEQTAASLGLERHPMPSDPASEREWDTYTSLLHPPALHLENAKWATSIYRGMVPAKNILKRDFTINGAVVSPVFLLALHYLTIGL
jgi:hypothetical protein